MKSIKDWRELDAGPDLDKLICEIVGWSVSTNSLQNTATLWDPDMNIVNTWGSSNEWPAVVNIAWYNAPRYSRNTNDAISLFEALPNDCTPQLVRMLNPMGDHIEHTWKAVIIVDDHNFPVESVLEEAATPALAICRAWLAWKEVR